MANVHHDLYFLDNSLYVLSMLHREPQTVFRYILVASFWNSLSLAIWKEPEKNNFYFKEKTISMVT